MHGYTKLIVWLLLFISSSSSYFGHGDDDADIRCLKDLKQSLIDPGGLLSSWKFIVNRSDPGYYSGYICVFIGVQCWHPDENRVLDLNLGNLGLEGPFPGGLEHCSSLTALDLSGNKFSGPLPANISQQIPYMSSLDLSNNSFSGGIPASIANMTYLNTLALQGNQFAGQIPGQLGDISRLVSFSVADNSLSGRIPDTLQRFPGTNFTGNQGLCGAPLDSKCKKKFRLRIRIPHIRIRLRLHRINDDSSIGAAVGFVAGFVVAFYFPNWFVFSDRLRAHLFRVCG